MKNLRLSKLEHGWIDVKVDRQTHTERQFVIILQVLKTDIKY